MPRDRDQPRAKVSLPAWPASGGADGLPGSPEEQFASGHPQPHVEVAELERAARQVLGVHNCRVLRRGEEALPCRVHVVVQGARRLAVAKDIQSAWFALWGLYVPRALFVVTAVRSRLDLIAEVRRLQFVQCTLTRAGPTILASVALSAGGRTFEGHAAQPALSADPMRLAAHAALEAVGAALPGGRPGDVIEMRRLRVAGASALLCAVDDGRGRLLLGVARVRGDERDAAVRAVLDAVNRAVLDRA